MAFEGGGDELEIRKINLVAFYLFQFSTGVGVFGGIHPFDEKLYLVS